jgi:hypothetical protein
LLSSSGLTGRRDNGDATADEVSHQRRQAIEAAIEPMVLTYVPKVSSLLVIRQICADTHGH